MKTIHMIGNAHLDPVWLWDWREGYQENQATILSALNRLEEFDDFIFSCSSAQFYEWIEEGNPELFEKIKKYVEEGRWVIVGGWWVQPDCNIPNGESFVRHALISQNYFKEYFGKIAHTGYNVDSFGHNAMLPQILKKSGIDNYLFQRPAPHEKGDMPESLFKWEAPDGSSVNTFRIIGAYGMVSGVEKLADGMMDKFPEGVEDLMLFYGVGNHGGGPTIEIIKEIKEAQKKKENVKIVFSDPNTYFATIKDCELPVVKDELQHHAPGCYAAESMVKAMNRRAENALLSAEKMIVMAEGLGKDRNYQDLTDAWKQLLFNQFHDTLAGSGIEKAYYDARNQLGEVVSVADRTSAKAVRAMSYGIDIPLDPSTQPMVVYNPHSWDVKAPVEFENGLFANAISVDNILVLDSEGNSVPFQHVDPACRVDGRRRITFMAEVPALGYAVYFMKKSEPKEKGAVSEELILENEILRVEFDKETGGIASILDKRTGNQVLASSVRATVIDDDTDTWGHSLVRLDQKCGEFTIDRTKVMDKGEVRQCVKVISRYGQSTLSQVYSLYEGEDQVHVEAAVNWQEHRKALKLEFPVNVENGQAAAEIPFGHILKKMDGKEEPMQQWADISGENVGLSVINDSKYSVDFHDNTIGFTVLRSPVYAHHDPYVLREDEEYSYIDQGIQHFTYVILPHAGSWRQAGTMKAAALLNQPMITTFETFHEGTLPKKGGFLQIDQENILMTALKKAYHNDGVVIRLYESFGEQTEVHVKLFEADFKANFGPYEIKTFKIGNDGSVKEVNLLEWEVEEA